MDTTYTQTDYVYASRKDPKSSPRIILLAGESQPTKRVFIFNAGRTGISIGCVTPDEFQKLYIGLMFGKEEVSPNLQAAEFLKSKRISTEALDNIERILKMDTRGKSTEQIRQETARLAVDLPQGHALRDVPKTYPDRVTAISAYSAVRQALFSLNADKERSMKPAADAKPEAKAKAKPAADAKPEAKAKATTGAKDLAEKAKAGRKPNGAYEGPFKLSESAVKAKEPSGLGMHEGSARWTLMSYMFMRKSVKPVGMQELEEKCGDQARQAVVLAVRKGWLVAA